MMKRNCVSVLQVAQGGKLVGILMLDDFAAVNLYTSATVISKAVKENLRRLIFKSMLMIKVRLIKLLSCYVRNRL